MVFHRLNHNRVLQRGRAHLHAARSADARMRDVPVARDFVGCVHDDNSLASVVREHPRYFAQHRRLAHARLAQQQHAPAACDQILYDADSAVHSPAHAQRQPNYLARAVSHSRYAMQRALYARAVVLAESADALDDPANVRLANLILRDK